MGFPISRVCTPQQLPSSSKREPAHRYPPPPLPRPRHLLVYSFILDETWAAVLGPGPEYLIVERFRLRLAPVAREGNVDWPQWPAALDRVAVEVRAAVLDRVAAEVRAAVQKARLGKKMSQAELAKLINERAQVVQEYESGKAVPNQAVLAKMERVLEVKLRGKIK